MINIFVATENIMKTQAVKETFKEYFDEETNVEMVSASSEVPRQPINEATIIGAQNRIKNLKSLLEERKQQYDFLVAVEGGIVQLRQNWYNIQFVLIENNHGKRSSGISQAFEIPTKYIDKAKATSINVVFANIFGKEKDGLEIITHGLTERTESIRQGVRMALAGLLNGEKW